jgi:peptidoglycan/LPS O-acetylase OafA/YrhL
VGNFMRGLHPLADRPSLKMLGDFAVQSRTFAKVHFSFGHFWSLCVEEQFYLLWPWVVFWVRDRSRLMWVCAVCVVACPLMRVAGNHMLPQYMLDQEVLYRWTPFHVDALLLGGWVALARRGRFAGRLLLGARAGSGILLGALALWLALNQWRVQGPGGYVYPAWKLTWGLTFADVLSACLIVTVIENGSIAFRIFNLRPLRWLRRISYGAYVFHDILHGEYSAFITNFYADPRGWVTAGFGLACTLVLAWASFRWYEMPFIRLKERWTRGAEGEGKAVAAG